MTDQEFLDIMAAFEVKPIVQEFRVYYGDDGKIVCYTMEDLPGNYIVITKEQYAESRYDSFVKNGKLLKQQAMTYKFEKSTTGTMTSKYDINILVNDDGQYWQEVGHDVNRNDN